MGRYISNSWLVIFCETRSLIFSNFQVDSIIINMRVNNWSFLMLFDVAGWRFHLWRDHADGALCCAAVPRSGLGPTAPPLCRCAECPIGMIWLPAGGCSARKTERKFRLQRQASPLLALRPTVANDMPRRFGCRVYVFLLLGNTRAVECSEWK